MSDPQVITWNGRGEAKPTTITFYTGAAGMLVAIYPDGHIERGPAFTTSDHASLQVWDILAKTFPQWREAVIREASRRSGGIASLQEWEE
jgi:hypothetical protein